MGLHSPSSPPSIQAATIKKENREGGGGANPEPEGTVGEEMEKENKREGGQLLGEEITKSG